MRDKRRKLLGLLFSIAPLVVGLFLIHRGTINKTDMKVVTGKVISKSITSSYSYKGGRHFFLTFGIDNLPYKIAISYATEHQAKTDSAVNLIDIGKAYTFYLDPTYPINNGQNNGIDVIDDNGADIYKASYKTNLYAGIFFIVLSLILTSLILLYKKKENGSQQVHL